MGLWNTPAKAMSSVFIMLGEPENELLQQHELAQIVFRKLALYYEGIRASDQNISAKKTIQFTLEGNENSVNLTDYTEGDVVVPLWCERLAYNATGSNPVWVYVPTVNMDTLPERRAEQIVAVGYYGDIATQLTAEFSYYGNEAVAPYNTFRIWYTPQNVFSGDIDATVNIPDNLMSLIVVDSAIAAIPLIKNKAARYVAQRPELQARIKAWNEQLPFLAQEKEEWKEWWEAFRIQSRGYHRAVNHLDVLTGQLGRRRYGGGYGNGWGG